MHFTVKSSRRVIVYFANVKDFYDLSLRVFVFEMLDILSKWLLMRTLKLLCILFFISEVLPLINILSVDQISVSVAYRSPCGTDILRNSASIM